MLAVRLRRLTTPMWRAPSGALALGGSLALAATLLAPQGSARAASASECARAIQRETDVAVGRASTQLRKCSVLWKHAGEVIEEHGFTGAAADEVRADAAAECEKALAEKTFDPDGRSAVGRLLQGLRDADGDECSSRVLFSLGHLPSDTFGDKWARIAAVEALHRAVQNASQGDSTFFNAMDGLFATGACPSCRKFADGTGPCRLSRCEANNPESGSEVTIRDGDFEAVLAETGAVGDPISLSCTDSDILGGDVGLLGVAPNAMLNAEVRSPALGNAVVGHACVQALRSSGFISAGVCNAGTNDGGICLSDEQCSDGPPSATCQGGATPGADCLVDPGDAFHDAVLADCPDEVTATCTAGPNEGAVCDPGPFFIPNVDIRGAIDHSDCPAADGTVCETGQRPNQCRRDGLPACAVNIQAGVCVGEGLAADGTCVVSSSPSVDYAACQDHTGGPGEDNKCQSLLPEATCEEPFADPDAQSGIFGTGFIEAGREDLANLTVNGPCLDLQTGPTQSGAAFLANTTRLTVLTPPGGFGESQFGPDGIPCNGDDTGVPGTPTTIALTTGHAEAVLLDQNPEETTVVCLNDPENFDDCLQEFRQLGPVDIQGQDFRVLSVDGSGVPDPELPSLQSLESDGRLVGAFPAADGLNFLGLLVDSVTTTAFRCMPEE